MLDYLKTNYLDPLEGFDDYEDFAIACMNGAVMEELQWLYSPNIKLHFPNKEIVYRSNVVYGEVPLTANDAKELVNSIKKENEPCNAFIATYKNGGNITVVCIEKNAEKPIVIVRDSETKSALIKNADFSTLHEAFIPICKHLVPKYFPLIEKADSHTPNNSNEGATSSSKAQIAKVSSNSFMDKIKKFFGK